MYVSPSLVRPVNNAGYQLIDWQFSMHMAEHQKWMALDNQTGQTILLYVSPMFARGVLRMDRTNLCTQACTPVIVTSGILSMADKVLQQTFPEFLDSPGIFFKMLAIVTSLIVLAAQQRLVAIALQQLLTMLRTTLGALSHVAQWLPRPGQGGFIPLPQARRLYHGDDFEPYPMSRSIWSWGRTTTESSRLGEPGLPMRPQRALLPGWNPRSNTN